METKEYYEKLTEGKTLELKKASGRVPDSFYETYSAFANTSGGMIYLGVSEEKGKNIILGVSNPEEMAKNILYSCHNKGKVSVDLINEEDIEIIDVEGKRIIAVKIREANSNEKPVYINGVYNQAYKRKGEADMLLDKQELLYYFSLDMSARKDMETVPFNISISSLNQDSIEDYKKEFMFSHGNKSFADLDNESFLRKIGAMVDDGDGNFKLTNGAVLFFGNYSDIIRIYPLYFLDYRRYDATSSERWSRRITSDDFSFSGNVYDFFTLVREDVKSRLPNPFHRDGATNIDGNDIYVAMCEGMANALCNADYSLSGSVSLVFKNNSFLFRNSGRLGVSLAQARSGGLSRPYNESIMNFFRHINVVEKAGSGIPKIIAVAERYGYYPPTIKEDAENIYTEVMFSFIPLGNVASSSLKEKIISLISERGELSTSEIAESLSISRTQAINLTRELLVSGIIKDNGKSRKGRKLSLAD